MIVAGLRRFLIILGALVGGTTAIGALVGLASGHSLNRAISLGLYGVGSFCTIIGFAMTMRGALRPHDRDGHAVVEDTGSARSASGLLITAGLVVIVVGMAVDNRVRVL